MYSNSRPSEASKKIITIAGAPTHNRSLRAMQVAPVNSSGTDFGVSSDYGGPSSGGTGGSSVKCCICIGLGFATAMVILFTMRAAEG